MIALSSILSSFCFRPFIVSVISIMANIPLFPMWHSIYQIDQVFCLFKCELNLVEKRESICQQFGDRGKCELWKWKQRGKITDKVIINWKCKESCKSKCKEWETNKLHWINRFMNEICMKHVFVAYSQTSIELLLYLHLKWFKIRNCLSAR